MCRVLLFKLNEFILSPSIPYVLFWLFVQVISTALCAPFILTSLIVLLWWLCLYLLDILWLLLPKSSDFVFYMCLCTNVRLGIRFSKPSSEYLGMFCMWKVLVLCCLTFRNFLLSLEHWRKQLYITIDPVEVWERQMYTLNGRQMLWKPWSSITVFPWMVTWTGGISDVNNKLNWSIFVRLNPDLHFIPIFTKLSIFSRHWFSLQDIQHECNFITYKFWNVTFLPLWSCLWNKHMPSKFRCFRDKCIQKWLHLPQKPKMANPLLGFNFSAFLRPFEINTGDYV